MIDLSEAEQSFVAQHMSRKDVVLKLLRAAIVDGRLAPGQKLDQNEIAARFNVSRMPVREALKQLESEGLVVVYPYRGVEVAQLDIDEVSELFAIRGSLERLAVGRAVDMLRKPTFERLREILESMDKMVGKEAGQNDWSAANREFHDIINGASGWPRLLDSIATFRDKVDRYVRLYFSMGGRAQSQIEHWALLEALEARDRLQAEKLIEDHSNSTAKLLIQTIEGSGAKSDA
ncbi:GntR family transcriptional regulator [Mariluticola halotolerans]|uniref:GntR family transcriptional regulator n=1 Tax=Mariluticola halotolerans TaxID=2909283 RepID=UPI0026E38F5F|nr:GntR family transcriptional regulator [Mariluticola halotolerans]UJQ95135.1 GntR family transcriptional regulator [Mariluticola halotolerans]